MLNKLKMPVAKPAGDEPSEEMMMEEPSAEEAAPADLSAISDDDLLAEAKARGLVPDETSEESSEIEEPMPMEEDELL